MRNLVDPGGHLLLTMPYNESAGVARLTDLPNFRGGAYGAITRIFCRPDLNRWQERHAWTLSSQEYYRVYSGPYYGVGDLVVPPQRVERHQLHHLTCLVWQADRR